MLVAEWSTLDGRDCIRITGVDADAGDPDVRVEDAPAGFPAVSGRFEQVGAARCFVPRFPFAAGVGYVVVDSSGRASPPLRRVPAAASPSTTVTRIWPTAASVPRNLLRFAIEFSGPMSDGDAAESIRLLADDGSEVTEALLPTQYELWDGTRTRLTMLLDPGRIKQGLARHERDGYPLAARGAFRLVVDAAMRDAAGARLRTGGERRYAVVDQWTDRMDPRRWSMSRPTEGTVDPLEIAFDRSLDHALLQRCLRVRDAEGPAVAGRAEIGAEERSWRFVPTEPWRPVPHRVEVDGSLEDLAGNTVARPFDRDLAAPGAAPSEQDASLRFTPSPR